MGRIRKSLKSHVETMVTCGGLSKSYQQLGSEENVIGDSMNRTLTDDYNVSPASISTTTRNCGNSTPGRNNTSFCYSCSECGHRGTIENGELDSDLSVESLPMKDKLNNDGNFEKTTRGKCDITNRKRTPDDVLLSCIVVNNDLHGTNEKNELPITMSKAISGVKFTTVQNNRTIDTLIKRRFLQIFHTPKEIGHNVTFPRFSLKSSTQLQNENPQFRQQKNHQNPYPKPTLSTPSCVCCRSHSQKRNNRQMLQNNVNTTCSSFKHDECTTSQTLSEPSHCSILHLNSAEAPRELNSSCCVTDNSWAKVTRAEEIQLRNAGWYQPGLSREIVTEVLSATSSAYELPYGAFLVRSSLTHPDNFALSVKVPVSSSNLKDTNTSSTSEANIAHYLIIASLSHGYRINGSAKSFPTLFSLIVHHSVMKEILPCTLQLNVGSLMTLSDKRFSDSNNDSASSNNQNDDDVSSNLTCEDIDIVRNGSEDISDANYPDLLCTLRKALLSSSFSEDKNDLIFLP